MTIQDLARELSTRFRPEAAIGVDMVVRLDVSDQQRLVLKIANCTLTVADERTIPDVTFQFPDLPSTFAIIRGQANAIEEFMHDRFRSDGYLMMAFRLMELFGSRSLPPTPND